MDEAENLRVRKFCGSQVERLEDRRESMEGGKRDLRIAEARYAGVDVQADDAREGSDPTAILRIFSRYDLRELHRQGTGVARGRVGQIRERFLPRLEVLRR